MNLGALSGVGNINFKSNDKIGTEQKLYFEPMEADKFESSETKKKKGGKIALLIAGLGAVAAGVLLFLKRPSKITKVAQDVVDNTGDIGQYIQRKSDDALSVTKKIMDSADEICKQTSEIIKKTDAEIMVSGKPIKTAADGTRFIEELAEDGSIIKKTTIIDKSKTTVEDLQNGYKLVITDGRPMEYSVGREILPDGSVKYAKEYGISSGKDKLSYYTEGVYELADGTKKFDQHYGLYEGQLDYYLEGGKIGDGTTYKERIDFRNNTPIGLKQGIASYGGVEKSEKSWQLIDGKWQ